MVRPSPKAPKPWKSPAETRVVLEKLWEQHPNADTELHFTNAYELLVATILSAQCTDERVNQVTPPLFKRYPDAHALARATTAELEPQIQSTGFFRSKSKSLLGMATELVERHGGHVPASMDELVELPGVGRKTANVVLGHALGVPGLPVDRHVLRVSNRIGIARSEDPEIVEQQLCSALPSEVWTKTSDALILHGRRICKPRPLCDQCAVRDHCDYYQKVIRPSAIASARKPKKAGSRALTAVKRAMAPANRSGSSKMPTDPRAPQTRGTGRGGLAPESRPESSNTPKHPRAAKLRATARGGAASAKAPASLAEAQRRRGAPREIKE